MKVLHLAILVALAAPCGAARGQPADQVAFVAANAVPQPSAGTRTPLKGVERKIAARDKAVCAVKAAPEIRDWVGVVDLFWDEGDAIHIRIAIGGNVSIGDLFRPKSLRRPTNAKERAEHAAALAVAAEIASLSLRKGERVVFSGRLKPPNLFGGQCYGLNNLFIQDRYDKPEYHIRFSKIYRI